MTPYEILLSESQERMLVVAEPRPRGRDPGGLRQVGARAPTPIGQVTDDGIYPRAARGAAWSPRFPGQRLVDDCPIYDPEARESDDAQRPRARAAPDAARRRPISRARCRCCSTRPTIASKRWVYEQYDSTVQASTVLGPGGDAGVLRVPGTDVRARGDGRLQRPPASRSTRTRAARPPSPRPRATSPAPARVPLGITNCLNFGNPEKPEVFFQFREACRGMADACRAFGTPVTGGNVSLLQREPDRRGRSDARRSAWSACSSRWPTGCPSHFRRPGDDDPHPRRHPRRARRLGLLGRGARLRRRPARRAWISTPSAACSDCWSPRPRRRLLRSAHDCSEGGLAVALAEAAIGGAYAPGGLGATVDLTAYGAGMRRRRRCCSARTAPGSVVSRAPGACRRRCWRWPASTACRCIARAGSASPAARWNSGSATGCSRGASTRCGRPISMAIPAADAASGRGPLGGRVRHVRHLRRLRACLTRPGSPTSGSTPCSTAARRARASSRSTATAHARSHRGMGLVCENFEEPILAHAAGRRRRRPHPLLDHRQHGARQRAAVQRRHPLRAARHRAQRQPHQRRRAQAGAGREGRDLHHLVATPRCWCT